MRAIELTDEHVGQEIAVTVTDGTTAIGKLTRLRSEVCPSVVNIFGDALRVEGTVTLTLGRHTEVEADMHDEVTLVNGGPDDA